MCVSGIIFIGYAKYRRNIGKQNELKVLESTTTKGHKQDSKNWLRSPMSERVLIIVSKFGNISTVPMIFCQEFKSIIDLLTHNGTVLISTRDTILYVRQNNYTNPDIVA
jgi:hypothetical protein